MITLGISEIGCPLLLMVVGFVSMLTPTVFVSLKNNYNLMAVGTCKTAMKMYECFLFDILTHLFLNFVYQQVLEGSFPLVLLLV